MIKIFNTLTNSLDDFKPIEKETVKIYSCGMTVQDRPHIGHLRALIVSDIIRRTFILHGYNVISVYNYTDIDDKLIDKSKERNMDYRKIADDNIRELEKIMYEMNVIPYTYYPRATMHIQEIIEIVEKLIDNGYAYTVDGDVFFSIEKFDKYGKLSGKNMCELIKGKRVEVNDKKENPLDFVLWKSMKEGEPYWYSPFGKGRPGWHIECSAMSSKYLSETFDIHTGGEDLIFPHHENEIAQSECAFGKKFVNYWVHNGMVNLKGAKMSKSTGNFLYAEDFIKNFNTGILRLYFYKTHYRKLMDFNENMILDAKSAYERIMNGFEAEDNSDHDINILNDFKGALFNDFNTPQALSVLFEAIALRNKKGEKTGKINASIKKMVESLGFTYMKEKAKGERFKEIMDILIKARSKAKDKKQFEISDMIRDELKSNGIILMDTKEGAVWKTEE